MDTSLYNFSTIDSRNVALFEDLIPPNVVKSLYKSDKDLPYVSVGVKFLQYPAGAALCEIKEENFATFLSLYLLPPHDKKDVGVELIRLVEKALAKRGCTGVHVSFLSCGQMAESYDRFFSQCGYPVPKPRSVEFIITEKHELMNADWPKDSSLPDEFEIMLWKDVIDKEKKQFEMREPAVLQYTDGQAPLHVDFHVESATSIVLRHNHHTVGWIIAQKGIAGDLTQYKSIYISRNYRNPVLFSAMLGKVVQLHFQHLGFNKKIIFLVDWDNKRAMHLFQTLFHPYVKEFTLYGLTKKLKD